MPYQTRITGEIFPISKYDYMGIEESLRKVFSSFNWLSENNGTLKIDSYEEHPEDELIQVFDKISDIIKSDSNLDRYLEEKGENPEDITIYFFKKEDWVQDYVDIIYPKNPFAQEEE